MAKFVRRLAGIFLDLVLFMYYSLRHDLISLILHPLCFLLFWFAAIKRIEPYFRSDPRI